MLKIDPTAKISALADIEDSIRGTVIEIGARTFVEVGPKAALTGMVRAILGDRPFTAMAVDASGKRGGLFDLAQLLGGLAVAGHSVQLGAWERRAVVASAPRKAKMSVPLTGANYRSPETSPAPPPRRAPAAPGAVAVVKAPVAPTVTAGVVAATSPRAPGRPSPSSSPSSTIGKPSSTSRSWIKPPFCG